MAAQITPRGQSEDTASPAVLTRSFGQGRAVYFAAGIDHAHYSYSYPYYRRLLAGAIRWAANDRPPLEVTAPMCVQSTLFRQQLEDRPSRLVIHLFNNVNTTAFHGLPNDDVPLRETLPIHDIVLTLRGHQVTSAVQQPEAKELTLQRDGDVVRIVVPRLEVHSMVVVE